MNTDKPKIIVSTVGGRPSVLLLFGNDLVGGWMNQPGMNAAEIAAEVLKVALPDVKPQASDAEALAWWKRVRRAQDVAPVDWGSRARRWANR